MENRPGGLSPKGQRKTRPADVEEHFPDSDETFQVLEEEGLSRLQVILRYAADEDGPSALHRAALIEGLPLAWREDPDAAASLPDAVQLLEGLLGGTEEPVVLAAAAQLSHFAEALQQHCKEQEGGEEGASCFEEAAGRLLGALGGLLLEGPAEELQDAAVEAVPRLAACLSEGARAALLDENEGGLMCALVADADEELRIVAARLLPRLGACLPTELVEGRVIEQHSVLLADEDFDVRKDAVAGLHELAGHLQDTSIEAFVLPAFLKAVEDEIQYVRMECAAALPGIAQVSGEGRAPQLAEAADRLLTDRSRWVLHEARMQIGAFVRSPACVEASEVLVGEFKRMLTAGDHGEQELQEAVRAASDLPSMAEKLGSGWWEQLGDGLQQLCVAKKATLRAALAQVLYPLAAVCSDPASKERLSEVFLKLLTDQDNSVKSGLILGIGELLAILPVSCWECAAKQLPSMAPPQGVNCSGWRMRLQLAEQLVEIAGCGDRRAVLLDVLPFALQLSRDPVAAVRRAAATQAARIFNSLMASTCRGEEKTSGGQQQGEGEEQELMRKALDSIKEFALSKTYTERQSFADMCSSLVLPLCRGKPVLCVIHCRSVKPGIQHAGQAGDEEKDAGRIELLECLADLSRDPVAVVRSRAAQALAEILSAAAAALATEGNSAPSIPHGSAAETARGILLQMHKDRDSEVSRVATKALPLPPDDGER